MAYRLPDQKPVPIRRLDTPLSKRAIEIINPLPGGMKYTCKPEHFVQIGVAEMHEGKLLFRESHQDRFIPRSKYFWNGAQSPIKMHQPGEVRS